MLSIAPKTKCKSNFSRVEEFLDSAKKTLLQVHYGVERNLISNSILGIRELEFCMTGTKQAIVKFSDNNDFVLKGEFAPQIVGEFCFRLSSYRFVLDLTELLHQLEIPALATYPVRYTPSTHEIEIDQEFPNLLVVPFRPFAQSVSILAPLKVQEVAREYWGRLETFVAIEQDSHETLEKAILGSFFYEETASGYLVYVGDHNFRRKKS